MDQPFQLAIKHHQAGRLAEAEKLYRQILADHANRPDVTYLLGMVVAQSGRLNEAADLFRRTIEAQPKNPDAHYHLGITMRNLGRTDDAIESFQRAVRLKPDSPATHNQLALLLATSGRVQEAIGYHRAAIRLKPDLPDAHNNLGTTLIRAGDLQGAIAAYREALRLKPDYVAVLCNLGKVLADVGRLDEAVAVCREAIRLDPNHAESRNNLAIAIKGQGHLDAAIQSYRQAIRLRPNYPSALNNLGNALKAIGLLDEAIATIREAIRLKPGFREAGDNLVLAMNYHPAISPDQIFAEHRAWAAHYTDSLARIITPHANATDPDRRLKIGFVSSDFRRHAVGHFIMPVLENHDRENFEFYCYASVPHPDDATERMQAASDVWRNIVASDDDSAATLVRSDEIDILVDLAGHTAGNRLGIFARKPAPIQVTYLGYANTTGMSSIDYRLTDASADPSGLTEKLNAETLWRLPQCAWCYEPSEAAADVQPRMDGPVTFGCFNALAKINEPHVALWAQILKQTSGSRLILKSAGLTESSVRERLLTWFAEHDVAAARIELIGWLLNPRQHLDTYQRIDVALDTYPYHGTTTTCEALWMGVPVVTLAGNTHVSRVGVSLLNAIDLPELVAQSPEQYVSIAAALASDAPRLAALRRDLRPRMQKSPLADAPGFARRIENAFHQMWRQYCAGRADK